ncbi:MAG: PIN domain nuclease [Deltaproteobacteria bacterium]|nr:PIN domain nuclease [Deltaproteobacteria bacterium]
MMSNHLVLIDTSAWIHALRPNGSPGIREKVRNILKERIAASTEMVILELAGGAKEKREYEELLEDLLALHQLSVDEEVWRLAFSLHFELRRKGVSVPSTDMLIAAVAMKNKCVLLHNDKHFELIARHTSLKLL